MINNHLYRIDTIFQNITQAGRADNRIGVSKLQENRHSYTLSIDALTGDFVYIGNSGSVQVDIPKSLLDYGYDECSRFAVNFNQKLSEKFGIKLVDTDVLHSLENLPIPLPLQSFPIIERNGITYEIDVSFNEFRKVDEPFVHMPFSQLKQKDGQYLAYMDEDGNLETMPTKGYRQFKIEQLVKVAPVEVSKIYGIPLGELPDNDRDLVSNQEFIKQRLEYGQLPIIRIVDEDYFVDTRLFELRSCNKFWKSIVLEDYGHRDMDNNHAYLFDYLNRTVVSDFRDLTEIPKHSVFVVLPNSDRLDPIAAGRRLYKDPMNLVNRYPIQPRMEARIVPIEKTWLKQRIEYNKKNQNKIEKKTNAAEVKPGKPGKRLGF